MVKQLLGIVALTAIHFVAVVIAVDKRYGRGEILLFPLFPAMGWLGLASSSVLIWGFAFLNSLFCGAFCYFALAAIALAAPRRHK